MVLTEVLQHTVSLQLSVSDLVLQKDQLLLVLQLEHQQPPLAVLQLVYQLLLDLDLTGQVGQVRLEVSCWLEGAKVRHTFLCVVYLYIGLVLTGILSHVSFKRFKRCCDRQRCKQMRTSCQ